MSSAAPSATSTPTSTAAATSAASDVSYALVNSYSTVQVLSATQVVDVVYCTIKTSPSGVTASVPVQQKVFDDGAAGPQLGNLSSAIETLMGYGHVVAGVGSQTIDQSGLIADNVVFTVEYTDSVHAPNGATADATIPVASLDFSDALIGRTLLADAKATIDGVYANLKAAAGG